MGVKQYVGDNKLDNYTTTFIIQALIDGATFSTGMK
jgi:hypothetical protein